MTKQTSTGAPGSLADAGRLGAMAAGAYVAARLVVDPDLWGHLRFGLDALASGRLASVDPYSFTQDVPWINHEWLSEVLQAASYRAGGLFGLVALKVVVVAATGALLARTARRERTPQAWWLLAAAFLAMAPAVVTHRPQLWTLLGVAAAWVALASPRPLLVLPPMFALWANLHGGWIVGAGICVLWLFGRAIDARALRAVLRPGVAVLAALLATVLNPYGARLWIFLGSTVRLSRGITEWQPVWRQANAWPAVLWLLVAVIVVSTVIFSGTKWTWAEALPVLWLGGASLFVMRLGPLFAEVTALACSSGWRHADRPATVRPLPFIAIDALLMLSMAVPLAVAESRCPTIGGPSAVDIVAAGALDSPQVRGRLELPFDWGEYAIWHFGPRLRVSMDGRRETVYSESTVERQSAVAHGGSDGIAFLDRVRPEYVWLPQATGGATRQWLLTHGYRLDVTTPDSFIATRADLPVLGPGTPLRRCFP